jgi:hypothetical protein
MPKILKDFLAIALVLMAFSTLSARIIHVPGAEAGIQDAINASNDGDTVLVGPGIYRENLDFGGKAILLASSAGPALTEIWPADQSMAIITLVTGEPSGTVITGFTIGHAAGRPCIRIAGGAPNIIGNYFANNSGGYYLNDAVIYINDKSHAVIKNNLFYNPDTYINIGDASDTNLVITNNTIYGGRLGLYLRGYGSLVMNNLVSGCLQGVSVSGIMIRGYNNIWGNTTNWSFGSPDPTDISVDPKFIDVSSRNFGLLRSSGCIDAGNPDVIYNDSDGTRNDIGVFYFDQKIPAINNLSLAAENFGHVISHTPTFEWSYYDTVYMIQEGYEVKVGELYGGDIWTTGEVMSSDNTVLYGGPALTDGASYYCLARVYNGHVWGDWKRIYFRMNWKPPTPIPVWPIDNEVSIYGVRLLATSSISDGNGDPLTVDFEIAQSPGGELVASRYNVAVPPTDVNSGIFKQTWPVGIGYVWRIRSFDGYEYSDWSAYQAFTTRATEIINVPGEEPTIQAGIDAAQERDTVLVAPGTYTGDGNRDLRFRGVNLALKSSDGAAATIIDCQGGYMDNHWGFYLDGFEDSTALIEGFTIKNSYTDELGAIYLTTSSPTIAGCIITENEGSGIMAVSDNFKWANRQKIHIDNCTITNNTAHGIFTFSHADIINCLVSYNNMSGIYLLWPDSINVIGCLVRGNTQNGLYISTMSSGHYDISNNTFVGNNDGIYSYWEPPKALYEATISPMPATTPISRNIFAYNRQYGAHLDGMSISGFGCNDAFGNVVGDWYPIGTYYPHAGDTFGNISADPIFCDTVAGDFQISSTSSCVPAHNSCRVLMGAFGIGCDFICGDANSDSKLNLLDISYLINYLYRSGSAPNPITIGDVDHSGGINLSDISYMLNHLYRNGPELNCP